MRTTGSQCLADGMAITLESGTVDVLTEVDDVVANWQMEGSPVQVHPGDLGWNSVLGATVAAESLRIWRRGGVTFAVGMIDHADGLLRLAISPEVDEDEDFAQHIMADLTDPSRGVLPADTGLVEARYGTALRNLLTSRGWLADEAWTPLHMSLTDPIIDRPDRRDRPADRDVRLC